MTSKIYSLVFDFGASHPIHVFSIGWSFREMVSKRDNSVLHGRNLFFLHLKVGMTVLVDHSGKLFTKERCTIRDIITNQEVSQRLGYGWGLWSLNLSWLMEVFCKKNIHSSCECWDCNKQLMCRNSTVDFSYNGAFKVSCLFTYMYSRTIDLHNDPFKHPWKYIVNCCLRNISETSVSPIPLTAPIIYAWDCWYQVLLAVIKGAQGAPRVSAYTMQDALLRFYTKHRLFPSGLYAEIPAVQSWALKYGLAIKKIVTFWKFGQLFLFWGGVKVRQ